MLIAKWINGIVAFSSFICASWCMAFAGMVLLPPAAETIGYLIDTPLYVRSYALCTHRMLRLFGFARFVFFKLKLGLISTCSIV